MKQKRGRGDCSSITGEDKVKEKGLLCSPPRGEVGEGVVAKIGAKASWITLKHAGSRGVGVPLPTCLGLRLYPSTLPAEV